MKRTIFGKGKDFKAAPYAFTLIELLIVVAIIAILAAIAVPNFLEAQTRAKITRVYSDMRTIATAIESYTVDNTRPPIGGTEIGGDAVVPQWILDMGKGNFRWRQLTSPVAYLTIEPRDPFGFRIKKDETQAAAQYPRYGFNTTVWNHRVGNPTSTSGNHRRARAAGVNWWLDSRGPSRRNRAETDLGNAIIRALLGELSTPTKVRYPDLFYDTTNGTKSYGRIIRTNRGVEPAI